MIGKLKRKFILLATVSMFVLMSVLLLIMNAVNYTAVVSESDEILDLLSQPNAPFFDGKEPGEKPDRRMDDFIPRGMSPEVPYESRFFSVRVSPDGEIRDPDFSRIISVNGDSAEKYIDTAISRRQIRGFIGQFRYSKTTDGQGTRLLFLDCGRKLDSFYTFLWISLGVGLLGCLTVFVLFLFVSGRIIQPIAESYEKQKRFISDAGHEIKTPLTIIKANLDLLEGPEEKEELNDIREQTKRLTKLTNDLVSLSKMEESGHRIQKVEMPVSDLVQETANSFRTLADDRRLTFSVRITPDLSASGSPDGIRELVSILLENAVKYSPEGGAVTLSLTAVRKSAVLSVSNRTGAPVRKADLPFVFDRFYRTDSSRNSSTGGHGLGLSIAKAIVEDHNGSIQASTETGQDFCVSVTLPILI